MPPLPPVPGVLRCVVNGTFAGFPTVSTLYVGEPGNLSAWDQAGADAVALNVRTAWISRILTQQNAVWTLNDVTATDLTNFLGVVGIAVGSNPGGQAGTPIPANCTACISWKSNLHYRGGHPRLYLPAPGTTTTVSGTRQWSVAYRTALANGAEAFRGDLVTLYAGRTARHVAVHRTVGGLVQTPPIVLAVVSASVDIRIDSQRRRLGPDVAA